MKASKIFLVFASVIIALYALSMCFPQEGVTIGSLNLRFPSLHSIVESRQPTPVEDDEELLPDQIKIRDSIDYYHRLVDSGNLRFWLPEPHYLDAFWIAVEQAHGQHRTVRIMHYGDSQIEMDHMTSRLRAYMQRTFGGGGPGMLPFRSITPNMTIRHSASGHLTHLASFGDSLTVRSRGNYGLMMQCFRLNGGSATMTVKSSTKNNVDEAAKRFSHVTLIANNRGNLKAEFTDLRDKKTSSQQKSAPEGVGSLSWSTDTISNSIRLRVKGSADLYGVTIDADYGVAVDNIPMRGCSGQQFTLVDEQMLTAAYATLDVKLIIMQFGGNTVPYLKTNEKISKYCQSIGKQIAYVHRCCPKAKILFIGPSDMSTRINGKLQTYPVIPQLIDSLAAAATANGAAYWSIYHAMGGLNSMPQWTSQGLAGTDYIHFSQKGADRMGDMLAEAFDNSYRLYLLERRKKGVLK